MSTDRAYFDAVYAEGDDPFRYRASWYERRKRQLLLAALTEQRYARGWEIGCSVGELTAELAERCASLLATDGNERAIAQARMRVVHASHVRTQLARHPEEWPEGRFDLIVFSEIGYYFDAATLTDLVRRIHASLTDEGTLVACHWRHGFSPAPLDGDQVHALLSMELPLLSSFHYQDADFVIDGWCGKSISLAQREGRR